MMFCADCGPVAPEYAKAHDDFHAEEQQTGDVEGPLLVDPLDYR